MFLFPHLSQMKLIQRLLNIWKLSAYEVDKAGGITGFALRKTEDIQSRNDTGSQKMAQIVKIKSDVEEFLKDNKTE